MLNRRRREFGAGTRKSIAKSGKLKAYAAV
jgi:hypothetical protein